MKPALTAVAVTLVVVITIARVVLFFAGVSDSDDSPRIDYDQIARIAADDFLKQQRSETDREIARTRALFDLIARVEKQNRQDAARLWSQARSAGLVDERGRIYAVPQGRRHYDGTPNAYSRPSLQKPAAGRYLMVIRKKSGRLHFKFRDAGSEIDKPVRAPRP